jgi:hypothetical protein
MATYLFPCGYIDIILATGYGRADGGGRWTPQAVARCLRDDIATMCAKFDGITTERHQAGEIMKFEALLKRC